MCGCGSEGRSFVHWTMLVVVVLVGVLIASQELRSAAPAQNNGSDLAAPTGSVLGTLTRPDTEPRAEKR